MSNLNDQGLTEAEAELVAQRVADSGRSEDEVVDEVKAERVGPAATWEDKPEIPDPVVPEIESLREQLDQASQRRIAAAGNDRDRALNEAGRLKGNLEEINAYLLGDVEKVFAAAEGATDDGDAAGSSSDGDVDPDEATAVEVVAHLRDHPEDADDIEEQENAREGGARKTVLDAVERARKSEGGES